MTYAGDDWVSPGSGLHPFRYGEFHGYTSNASLDVIPAVSMAVITSIDLFYYGGYDTPIISLNVNSGLAIFLNWRPESSNEQSLHWGGWQVMNAGDFIEIAISDGAFDGLISGWLLPAPNPP